MKLELKNINKTFGSTKVLENINFQLNKKECVGIIGPVSYTHLTLPTSDLV